MLFGLTWHGRDTHREVSVGRTEESCVTAQALRHPNLPSRYPDLTIVKSGYGRCIVRYQSLYISHMSVVLPGETIQAQHKTLKLGPGLQQIADSQGKPSIVVTRAGTLEQNPKGNKFWVEGNSRRVSSVRFSSITLHYLIIWTKVRARGTRACCRHHKCPTGGGLESGYRRCPSGVPRWACLRGGE